MLPSKSITSSKHPKEKMQFIGKKIQDARKALYKTANECAAYCGISRRSWYNFEVGVSLPNDFTKILEVLEVKPQYFMYKINYRNTSSVLEEKIIDGGSTNTVKNELNTLLETKKKTIVEKPANAVSNNKGIKICSEWKVSLPSGLILNVSYDEGIKKHSISIPKKDGFAMIHKNNGHIVIENI